MAPNLVSQQSIDPKQISIPHTKARQEQLLAWMNQNGVEWTVLTTIEHIQYFIGPRFAATMSPVAAIFADGRVVLIAPSKVPEVAVATQVETYEAKWHSTMRNDQRAVSTERLFQVIGPQRNVSVTAVEFSSAPPHLTQRLPGTMVDVEPLIWKMRRKKDADELAKLQFAIDATGAMYQRAREILRPGLSEIDMFNELQSVAVSYYGEMLTGTGNDYQCSSRGGAPRNNRVAKEGELYILDLGPAFRGYFADNARTLAVTEPTADQLAAYGAIEEVFGFIESTVRPGVSCKKLFADVQAMLDKAPVGVFNHHLGHGIGLFPHEMPHLNPHWDDTFEVGDVFTAEPGLYDVDRLRAGIRLENDYLVTESGVELLTPFPLALRVSANS